MEVKTVGTAGIYVDDQVMIVGFPPPETTPVTISRAKLDQLAAEAEDGGLSLYIYNVIIPKK